MSVEAKQDFSVPVVINAEFPVGGIEDYLHRISRAGRIVRSGKIITFFAPGQDSRHARGLTGVLQESGQRVPDGLDGSKSPAPATPVTAPGPQRPPVTPAGPPSSAASTAVSASSPPSAGAFCWPEVPHYEFFQAREDREARQSSATSPASVGTPLSTAASAQTAPASSGSRKFTSPPPAASSPTGGSHAKNLEDMFDTAMLSLSLFSVADANAGADPFLVETEA